MSTETTTTLDRYHPESHERFISDTQDHSMTVLLDDGLYRHLRFEQPTNSWHYWFEIVTWPGALTIRGDMGCLTFNRVEDMLLGFFTEGYINPGYWAEKIAGDGRSVAHRHDEERVRKLVTEYWNDRKDRYGEEDQALIWEAIDFEILGATATSADATYQALSDFRESGFEFVDAWEFDFKDWTTQYLWCCHAIRFAAEQYKAQMASEPTS